MPEFFLGLSMYGLVFGIVGISLLITVYLVEWIYKKRPPR